MKGPILVTTFAASLALVLVGCSKNTTTSTDTRQDDIKTIHEMEEGWKNVYATKDAGKFVPTYYADDAKLYFPDSPVIAGLPAISAAMKDVLQDPNAAYDQPTPSTVEIS